MKKTTICLLIIMGNIINAQDTFDWQMGLNFAPHYFTQIKEKNPIKKSGNSYPNGFSAGITVEKNWNEKWGIKTGVEFSEQKERFYDFGANEDDTHTSKYFEYYKIPLTVQYFYPLSTKLFLSFNLGFQYSYLNYVKIVSSGNYQLFILTSDYYEATFFDNPNANNFGNAKQTQYKENLFGGISSIGLKGKLSSRFSYSTNVRFEYDFTNAKNYVGYVYDFSDSTHNLRIALELGLQYHFSIEGIRFNKSPHKL